MKNKLTILALIFSVSAFSQYPSDKFSDKFNKAVELDHTGKHKKAIKVYKEILSEIDDMFPVYVNMSNSYIKLHQYDKALECINEAIKLKEFSHHHEKKAHILSKMGNYREAYNSLKKSIELIRKGEVMIDTSGMIEIK